MLTLNDLEYSVLTLKGLSVLTWKDLEYSVLILKGLQRELTILLLVLDDHASLFPEQT